MSKIEKTKPTKHVVYVNNNIKKLSEDSIGFDVQINSLKSAIKEDAKIIGLVGDFGSGKSSLIELISNDKKTCEKCIKINMWDSISDKVEVTQSDELSKMNKSFLYQLANGGKSRSLTSYVGKKLNKNTGKISINVKSIFWFWLTLAAVAFCIVAGIFYRQQILVLISGSFQ